MKTKHFLGMMAGAWMLASCSSQDELLQLEEVVTGQRVTVNAYVPDDADSRLAFDDQGTNGLKVSWKESGETFSVITADEAAPVTFTQTEGSEFAGPEGFTFTEGTQYYAFYPKLDEGTAVPATAVPYDISLQTGQLDERMNLMYAKRSADGDFQFKHVLAVMKFTLKGIKGELLNNVRISFSNDLESYYTFGTVDVTGGPTFTNDYSADVFIPAEEPMPDDEGNYVIYAYLPPLAAGTQISITAYSVDEEYYREYNEVFSIKEGGVKSGKYYTAARTMDVSLEIALNHTAGTVEELKAWIDAVGGTHFNGVEVNLTLTDDIDLSEADLDGDGTNESNWPNDFSIFGTVDGGGHSITGIKISSGDYLTSPFNIQSTGVVKNLHLKDVDISGSGSGCVGGIASQNNGTISGCSVSGSVTTLGSNGDVGGIAVNNYGTVTGCYNLATVTGVDANVSGIAGANYGTITACYNTGTLSATQSNDYTYIGGIAGRNNGSITACYWSATGTEYGIGEAYSNEGATKVDGEFVTWETAMETMNNALPQGFDWEWVKNTDENTRTNIPLVLQNVAE